MFRRIRQRFARQEPAPPTAEVETWVRAERLGLMYELQGAEPAVAIAHVIEGGYLDITRYDREVVHGIEYADFALFRAMQDVAIEQRERQYTALERLAALVNAEPDPTIDARWCSALMRDDDELCTCMTDLGWIAAAPDGE
jgi:hypothetical protein